MKYAVDVEVYCECEALNINELRYLTVNVDENLKDIVAFLFYKKYDKYYNELSWYLEPGAKEFVNELEQAWLNDAIDTFELYHNPEFLDFLSDNFPDNFTEDEIEDFLEQFEDEIAAELDSLDEEDIAWIIYNFGEEIEYSVGSATSTINIKYY